MKKHFIDYLFPNYYQGIKIQWNNKQKVSLVFCMLLMVIGTIGVIYSCLNEDKTLLFMSTTIVLLGVCMQLLGIVRKLAEQLKNEK